MSPPPQEVRHRLREQVGADGRVNSKGDGLGGILYTIKCRLCWLRPPRGTYLGERPVVSAPTGAEAWALWQEHARAHGDTPTSAS